VKAQDKEAVNTVLELLKLDPGLKEEIRKNMGKNKPGTTRLEGIMNTPQFKELFARNFPD